jgi:hypothetical protein
MKLRFMLTRVFVLLVAGALASSSYAGIDPETIAGIWLFDEGEGDSTADSSQNGNDGAITGAVWANGKFGKALEFDGNDNVDCGSDASLDITDAITIVAWAELNELDQMAAILEKRDCAFNNGYALLNGWSRNTYMELTSMGVWVQSGVLETDTWYHFAATWDSTTGDASFYQDGEKVQSKAGGAGAEIALNEASLTIGLRGAPCTGNFRGTIDEVAVFSAALEEEDIQKIMNEGLKAATGAVAVSSSGKLTDTWGDIKAAR